MTIVSENVTTIAHTPGEPTGYLAPGGAQRPSVRDRIKAMKPYSAETVHVAEWEADVELRSLSLGERNEILQEARQGDSDMDISVLYPQIIVKCSYDPETGTRLFEDDEIAFINSLPANLMDKLAVPAMKLSGMSGDPVDESAKKSSETEVSA